jgi:CRP/FNR family cyclic AMP-dependent transcriptional regulator
MVSPAPKEPTKKRPDFAPFLEMNPLFAGLGAEAVDKIAALCGKRKLAAGEVLFLKGDSGDAIYGVRRGRLRIETATEGGERLTLNVLGPGDVFGEVAFLDGQSRTAGCTAVEPTEVFVLHRAEFFAYLERDSRVAVRLIEQLCRRIRWMSERMEETALLPLHARLARRLCALADDFGADVHISQEELGVYVGAARESVNRQLQHWRKAGIISLHRGRISLLDIDRLAAEAGKG